jgi:4-hydroxybenzoate polyprenyltransferase
MFRTPRVLAVVSRLEFLPGSISFFVVGLAWSISPPMSFFEVTISSILVFAIIVLSTIIGFQVNTIFDDDLDRRDDRKARLVQALADLGIGRLKLLIVIETAFGFVFVLLLSLYSGKPALLFMWLVGIFLAFAYSVPPLRLKSRSWLALTALFLSVCVLPLLFTFYTFASEFDPYFLVLLGGQALGAYSTILATEIRDYFEDKEYGIKSLTVRIGLVRVSFLSILLLATGGTLTGIAFFAKLSSIIQPALSVFLITIAIADLFVLRKLVALHSLSKAYEYSKNQRFVSQEIKRVANYSPQWVILVSQTSVFMSLILIVGKFLL